MSLFNDLQKNRKARFAEGDSRKAYQVVRLTNSGRPNQMVPSVGFNDPESARLYVARIRGYNGNKTMRFTINGEEA
jgi:hypothetical protein